MYLIGAHMDGHGWGEAANDDGSGTAIVMELARILGSPEVRTERSIRFCIWNNEETGLNGARAYVAQRHGLQGREEPAGSGRYPEPKWLGMIQHDMMLFDHGAPRADGKVSKQQRPEADVNIEFQSTAKRADEAMKLAWFFQSANESYATDYPATVGQHMTNTDSTPFMDLVPAISLRENERGAQIGAGWDPQWHQPTDVYATYSDADFRLGLNAAQTTLGAVGQLAGVSLRRSGALPLLPKRRAGDRRERSVGGHFLQKAAEIGNQLLFAADHAGQVENFVLLDMRIGDAPDEVRIALHQQQGILGVDVGHEQSREGEALLFPQRGKGGCNRLGV
jgi:hypothetical protein